MENIVKRVDHRVLWIVFGFLMMTVIGLASAIVINVVQRGDDVATDESQVTYDMMMEEAELAYGIDDRASEIRDCLKNEECTLAEAEGDFEDLIEESSGKRHIYAIMVYAQFIYDATEDFDAALETILSIEPSVPREMSEGYYVTIRNLCLEAERYAEASEYNDVAINMAKGEE
ncbi:hypothetical protein IIY66_00750 [Candidatus Saccharibacteria bacterium]|nr:hypothetical protein [Candidatus Saccharibacteria bacterium]